MTITKPLQDRERKIDSLHILCKESAINLDLRIVGILSRYFAILAASYVELGTKEAFSVYTQRRCSPKIVAYVRRNIVYENSISCEKIISILERFDLNGRYLVGNHFSEPEVSAINALYNLRNQLAHGNDNGTSYEVVAAYFNLIRDYPRKLLDILESADQKL